jgi:NADH-quinone oxidoreductase subunit L
LLNLPHLFGGHSWLSSWLGREQEVLQLSLPDEYLLLGIASGVFLLGWLLAHLRYSRFSSHEVGPLENFLANGWYCDRFFERMLVRPFNQFCRFCSQGVEQGLVNGLLDGLASGSRDWSRSLRVLADGKIPRYLQGFAWGFLLIVGWFLLKAVV